jgi:protein TIF31
VLYDERSIKFQVRRSRDLMNFSSSTMNPSSLFDYLTPKEDSKKESALSSSDIPEDKKDSLLSDFYAAVTSNNNSNVTCVTSLTFSGWNPPPKYRKLAGDLVYLQVTTLENRTFHITGSTLGFYVNSSTPTTFNPNASDKPAFSSYTLVGLLNQVYCLFIYLVTFYL